MIEMIFVAEIQSKVDKKSFIASKSRHYPKAIYDDLRLEIYYISDPKIKINI